jgi:hypothetical protein
MSAILWFLLHVFRNYRYLQREGEAKQLLVSVNSTPGIINALFTEVWKRAKYCSTWVHLLKDIFCDCYILNLHVILLYLSNSISAKLQSGTFLYLSNRDDRLSKVSAVHYSWRLGHGPLLWWCCHAICGNISKFIYCRLRIHVNIINFVAPPSWQDASGRPLINTQYYLYWILSNISTIQVHMTSSPLAWMMWVHTSVLLPT